MEYKKDKRHHKYFVENATTIDSMQRTAEFISWGYTASTGASQAYAAHYGPIMGKAVSEIDCGEVGEEIQDVPIYSFRDIIWTGLAVCMRLLPLSPPLLLGVAPVCKFWGQ